MTPPTTIPTAHSVANSAAPTGENRWGLPNLGLGLGLRGEHIPTVLRDGPDVDWFEVITDNYLVGRGYLAWALDRIRERYPVVLHGVGLSIGSTDPLDLDYLRDIKSLAERIKAPWVSDHVCWTGVGGRNSHDLLPVPYNEAMLAWMVDRIRRVQDVLERPLILENPSSYLEFASSTMTEWDFIAALCERADCGLLLDVNNVYVSSHNHGFDPADYLAAVPWDRVVQFHVAGHTDRGSHILDSHIGPVIDPVWQLLADAWKACGGRATMLEWDDEIPDFETTWREAQKARVFMNPSCVVTNTARDSAPSTARDSIDGPAEPAGSAVAAEAPVAALMRWMHAVIAADIDADRSVIDNHILANDKMAAAQRLDVYTEAVGVRFVESMAEDFPSIAAALGDEAFEAEVIAYVRQHPSTTPWLELLGRHFAEFLATRPHPPWFADAARVRWAMMQARISPCFTPVDAAAFAAVPDEEKAHIRLEFAACARLVAVDWNVVGVLDGDEPRPSAGHVLVSRPSFAVQLDVLDGAQAAVLSAMMAGATLQEAVVTRIEEHPESAQAVLSALPEWTQRWAQRQVVTGLVWS